MNMELEFLAHTRLDEENDGKGYSVAVSDLEKLEKAVSKATSFKNVDDFMEMYEEKDGTAVYFELMAMDGISEHIGWVDIVNGDYIS